MRLQSLTDPDYHITLNVRDYFDNIHYYRKHYRDVTKESSPKQVEQRQNYIKLGQLHSLRTQLRGWRDSRSRQLSPVEYVAACDTIHALTRQIDELTATMKGNK